MRRLSLTPFLFAILVVTATAQMPATAFRDVLSREAQFTDADFGNLSKGDAVIRSLKSENRQDVAITAAIRIGQTATLEAFRASLSQRSNKSVATGKAFSVPPVAVDLDSVELSDDDLKELRNCRPAKCDFNLSGDAIARFQSIDWNAPDAATRARDRFNAFLLDLAAAYSKRGDAGLQPYMNRDKPFDAAAANRRNLESMPFLRQLSPALYDFALKYPLSKLSGASDELHWSEIDFGLNPSIVLTHSVAYSESGDHFVLNKQFYGSRYLDASVSMSLLLRVAENDQVVTYLVFSDRSSTDALGGPLGSMARKMAANEADDRTRSMLERAQSRLLMPPTVSAPPDAPESFWIRNRWPILIGIAVLIAIVFLLSRRSK